MASPSQLAVILQHFVGTALANPKTVKGSARHGNCDQENTDKHHAGIGCVFGNNVYGPSTKVGAAIFRFAWKQTFSKVPDGITKEKIMSTLSAVYLLLLAALFQAAAPANAPLSSLGQASLQKGADQRPVILREVRHELIMLPRYSLFDWIEFEVRPDNTVILRGQVRGLTLRADAESAVKRIEGVTGVINQIEDLPASPSDDRIRRRLYHAIYDEDGPLFRYAIEVIPSIHIIVKNGTVTLKGVVDSQQDSDFAYIRARSVSKTFSVKNDLVVEKRETKPGLTPKKS